MEFKEQLSMEIASIEDILDIYLPKEDGLQGVIMEAMRYSVKAGGKRIRPLLMKKSYQMFGGNGDVIKPFMAAMEMLHTYSLVHDDLPAMDNDDYRRGRKTTHVVFGEAVGVLAGDALLNYAYETACSAFSMVDNTEGYRAVSKALAVFMKKAGIYGMIGGQTVDVINDGKPVDGDCLNFIFRLKTGALLEASIMIGAILAGADESDIMICEEIGTDVGLAFQIQDDILDVTGDAGILGKPVLSDEKNNKTTYVTLYGLNKAHSDVEKYSKLADELVLSLERKNAVSDTAFFRNVINMLINRNK